MSPYSTVELGDVAEFVRGINFKPDDVVSVGEVGSVACMRTKNVQKDLDLSDVWAVSESFVKREEQILQYGDILISSANSWNLVGKCCWIPQLPWKTTFGGFVSILRAKNSKIEPRYLYHWFSSNRVQTIVRSFGQQTTNISNLNTQRCLKLLIPLPPLGEQKKIADILDRAEALRAKRLAALDQLDELAQSVFIEMFGDPRQLTKRENAKMRLRDVINIIVPTRDKPKSFTGNIPWITLPDLTNSIYIEDSKYKLSKEEAKPTKTRLFPKETVILSCAGSVGKVAIAVNEVYTNQQFYGLVCDKKRIVPEFLAYYLLLLGEDYYRGISGTSILSFFKKESALNIEIVLPEISNQIYFSQIVKQLEKFKQSHQQSLLKINSLFDSLMHEAFTGKLFSHKFFEREIENGVKI